MRYRLHYRIKPYEPDLKLVAFRTVPNVLNTAYTESRVCLQVASVGSHPTADYTPRIFLDNGGQPYHSLRRREGLGVFKREEVCETMPTPNVGQHSLRVQLDPEGLDHRLDNNRLVRNVHANKRLTHDQRWVRTNGQVGAYLRQVAELKNALQLVTVARARVSPRLRERRQTPPPPDLRADPQEILEMVRSVGRRTVLIQDEGAALRHAYVELERDAAAQEIANLLERANTLYPVTQDLQEYIRNNESEKIGQALESLTRGGPHMKERLTIAKKFWAR